MTAINTVSTRPVKYPAAIPIDAPMSDEMIVLSRQSVNDSRPPAMSAELMSGNVT